MILLFSLLCFIAQSAAGNQTCLSCKGAVQPRNCETITRCGPGESCYTEAVVTSLGFVRYNLGCTNTLQCNANPMPARKRLTDNGLIICKECCDGEVCNNAGCGTQGYPSPTMRGPLCYTCQEQYKTDDCNQISLCATDQVCLLSTSVNHVAHDSLFNTRCAQASMCVRLTGTPTSPGTCNSCCLGDLCNNHCNDTAQTSLSSTVTSQNVTTTSSTPIIFTTTLSGSNTTSSVSTMIASLPTATSSLPPSTTITDPCSPNPCVSGVCSRYFDTYKCACEPDAFGRNCDQYIDHCVTHSCVHGQCQSHRDTYTCTCSPGYTGKDCDTAIDHCLSNPCQYGTCISSSDGFHCNCIPGYQGATCNIGTPPTTRPPSTTRPTTVTTTTAVHVTKSHYKDHCKTPTDCRQGLAPGDYQSCKGCSHYLTCSAQGSWDRQCGPFLFFDSHFKVCVRHSSTCHDGHG